VNKHAGAMSALKTPTDLSAQHAKAIGDALDRIVADLFALYVKTKNFHWHMSGPHFRDYHLLLDDQGEQILATIDPLAERNRKLGRPTLKSIGNIARLARVKDNDDDFVSPQDMLNELVRDNQSLAAAMRATHEICDDAKDNGTAGLLESYIDQAETRVWFLFEAGQSHASA